MSEIQSETILSTNETLVRMEIRLVRAKNELSKVNRKYLETRARKNHLEKMITDIEDAINSIRQGQLSLGDLQ